MFPRGGKYPTQWDEFRAFGPTKSRFDHHPVRGRGPRVHAAYGILYAEEEYATALTEYFQVRRAINRTRHEPWLVQFALAKPLVLIDVTGDWILKAGGNSAISSGPREQSRKWSRAFHKAWPTIDGVCYRSSLNPEWIAYALYERARRAIPRTPLLHAPLTDSRLDPLLAYAATAAGYKLL
jgi:hypothetical protein